MYSSPNYSGPSRKKQPKTKKAFLVILFLTFLAGTSFIIKNSNAEDSGDNNFISNVAEKISGSENKILAQADTSSVQTTSGTSSAQTVTQTIYVKNTNDVSFDYDSNSVTVKDGKLQCIKDDRILQWHKGKREWECKKPSSSIFGNLDGDSVEVNDSGQLECKNDGDFLYWDGSDDEWACGDISGANVVSPGNGINLSGDELSINAPTCSGTDKLQWNGTAFICSADVDTTDHAALTNIGTNTHAQIDTHIADSTVHFTEGSIDHANIQNVGTNDHATIDAHLASTLNPHSVTQTDVGLGNVDNTADLDKPISTATQTALDDKEDTANRGVANGYAPLDSGGKVPVANLPSSIMEYQGVWDASTNTPTLADGSGDTGDVYRVSVSGSQDLGSGSISFNVGDYVIYNGSVWEKSDTTDSVSSIFGRTGDVTAQTNDYTWAQIDKTTSDIADITNRSHTDLTDIGTNTHAQIDTHISDSTLHFTESSIDHTNLQNIGTNTHAQIDTHIADSTVHFTEGSIDHNSISGLQGGTTNEYYHLTSSEHTDLSTFLGYTSLPDTDGTNGQVLQTDGAGALTWTDNASGSTTFLGLTDTMGSYTAGSVLFTSSSAVTEDNANLFYDDTADNLGIGTSTLSARTHIKGSTSDNTAYGLKVDDSSDAKNFYVRNDGQVEFKNYLFPTADGSAGEFLQTNGAGTLSFQEPALDKSVDTTDVSNPPTDAELDAAFGTPATVGAGKTYYIDDNGAGTNFYQVTSDGTNWWVFTGTKAI